MRRSRVTEMAQRQPPRNLRTPTSSSDNNRRSNIKPSEGRSPRGAQSDPANKKKLGTRIADLESQLGLAQEELKSLKTQIVSVEDKKSIKHDNGVLIDDVQKETDVFEVVPMEKVDHEEDEVNPKSASTESPPPDDSSIAELALKNNEINSLKANLEEKEKQLEVFRLENESLKIQLDEKSVMTSSAQSTIDELSSRLEKVDHELESSKIRAMEMNEKLSVVEKDKEELEDEMKRLRVQTEQWRKAADAAAAVLAGGVDVNGRRVSGRCGSMDMGHGNGFGPIGGYTGLIDDDDEDEDFGSGKRKGSGIRVFGDLWKKKGQK